MLGQLQSVDADILKQLALVGLAFLGGAAAISGITFGAITAFRKPRGTALIQPQPLEVRQATDFVSKQELLEVRARVAALEAVRERDISAHREATERLRAEVKHDIEAIGLEVRLVRDKASEITGEVKHINITLASIDAKLANQ